MKKMMPEAGTGIFTQQNQIKVRANYLTKPDQSLARLEQLRQGATPEILVSRSQGGGGDVLMTLPTVRAIASKYNSPVTYSTDFEYLDGMLPNLLKGISYIREVIPHTTSRTFDATINLTCPCIAHEKPGAPPINRIDLFARHAGVSLTSHDIDYHITDPEKIQAIQLRDSLKLNNSKLIIVNPSSSTSRRDLPYQVMASIVRKLAEVRPDTFFIILTHEKDSVASKQIGWNYLPRSKVINGMKVREIAALISLSDLVLCPDSALLHLSGALHKSCITFFGPTDPRARVNYYPESVAIWGAANLSCKNCWYEARSCGMACWNMIEIPVVINTALAILNKSPIPSHSTICMFSKPQVLSFEIL